MSICPFCLHPINGEDKCPNRFCGETVRADEWPNEYRDRICPSDDRRDVGGEPPDKADRENVEKSDCKIGFDTAIGDNRVYKISVSIDGGSGQEIAAVLRRDGEESKGWWLYCWHSKFTILLNHSRVACLTLIQDGDLVEVSLDGECREKVIPGGLIWDDSSHCLKGYERSSESVIWCSGLRASIPDRKANGGRKTLLQDIGFEVEKGELVGVIGPSGCGKSTLIQRLAGFSNFDSGNVKLFGEKEYRNIDVALDDKKIGYLPQDVELSLHGSLTLAQEIDCYCRVHALDVQDDRVRDEILRALDLTDYYRDGKRAGDKISQLSGGQKRRVGIALALLRKPELLLMDEPCAGLDTGTEQQLMRHVFHLCKRKDEPLTVVCVTHALTSADLFDRILVLKKGGVQADFCSANEIRNKFGVADLGLLYSKLQGCAKREAVKGKKSTEGRKRKVACFARSLVSGVRNLVLPAWWKRELTCFRRSLLGEKFNVNFTKTSCLGYLKRNGLTALSLGNVLQMIIQPVIIGCGIRLAFAGYMKSGKSGDRIEDTYMVLSFCSILSVFWIGINTAVSELVRERIPNRSLEHHEHIPLLAYLVSKWGWTLFVGLLQVMVFWMCLWALSQWGLPLANASQGLCSRFCFSFMCVAPLLMSYWLGASFGLCISAWCKTEQAAIRFVPYVAILSLLLSPVVIPFAQENKEYLIGIDKVAKCLPCFCPTEWFSGLTYAAKDISEKASSAATWFAGYVIALGMLTVFGQYWRELAWNGRGKE